MAKAGFRVLMACISSQDIGGGCLSNGCVPGKTFIHVAKIAQQAKDAQNFGVHVSGNIDIKKAIEYVWQRKFFLRSKKY